ncbi:MAG: hypothetical protein V7724_01510 [Sediminicola sp.]
MAFFYETFPIFLCGVAAGIVLTALVGWVIRGDSSNADLKRYIDDSMEEKFPEREPKMALHTFKGDTKNIKKNGLVECEYAVS